MVSSEHRWWVMVRFFWRSLAASALAWVCAMAVYLLVESYGSTVPFEQTLQRGLGIGALANPLVVALTCVFVRVTAQGRPWARLLDQRWPFAGLLTLATPVASLFTGVTFALVGAVVAWDGSMLSLMLQSAVVYTMLWQFITFQFLWTLLAGAIVPPSREARTPLPTRPSEADSTV